MNQLTDQDLVKKGETFVIIKQKSSYYDLSMWVNDKIKEAGGPWGFATVKDHWTAGLYRETQKTQEVLSTLSNNFEVEGRYSKRGKTLNEAKQVGTLYHMSMNEYSSEGEDWDDDEIEIERDGNIISVKISVGDEVRYKGHKGKVLKTEYDGVRVNFPTIGESGMTMHFYYEDLYSKEGYYQAVDESLNEAKKKKKKDNRKIGKPMRSSSGGKAYKVYVKDPKTKKIKTVRFGSGGLRAKINDKKARTAFAARHKCSQKKDKTKAGYWSCRLPRYAKLLGLKSSFSGFW